MSQKTRKHARRPAGEEVDLGHELEAGYAHRFIRFKAKQLLGKYGFSHVDREDLEQEMKLRLVERFGQFDPEKSDWPEFVTTVVERHVATLVESQTCLKRSPCVSLSEERTDEDGAPTELGEILSTDDRLSLNRTSPRSEFDLIDLEQDIESIKAQLEPESRRVYEALLRTGNVSDAAREVGINRSTVSSFVLRLRDVLAGTSEKSLKDVVISASDPVAP